MFGQAGIFVCSASPYIVIKRVERQKVSYILILETRLSSTVTTFEPA